MATRKSNTSRNAAAKRSTSQAYPRRAGKSIRAAIDDFLLDRESRNFSLQTLVQHKTSLAYTPSLATHSGGISRPEESPPAV